MVVKVGLVGCGAIGSYLAVSIQHRFSKSARLVGLHDTSPEAVKKLLKRLRKQIPPLPLLELVRRCDLLLEAASAGAVSQLLPLAIRHRKPVVVLSTGGLLKHPELLSEAARRGVPLYLPSGAVAGLDALKAHAIGRIKRVILTTRKPLAALAKAPGMKRTRSLAPRLVFRGTARQAAQGYPQNLNVAATLSLAGLGPDQTEVRVIADPQGRFNIHELEVVGEAGRLSTRVENLAMKENPKTSLLAAFSALALLKEILEPVRVGT